MDGQLKLTNSLIEQFQRAWQKDRPEPYQQLLRHFSDVYPQADPRVRRDLALELVKIDIEEHWRRYSSPNADDAAGATPRTGRMLEAYLPDLQSVTIDETALLDLLVHEYRVREHWGGRPSVDEYENRFEQLSLAMRNRLHDELMLEATLCAVTQECSSFEEKEFILANSEAAIGDATECVHSVSRILSQIRPFSELPQQLCEALALHTTIRTFLAGDTLLRQGDPTDCLLIVLEGVVEVSVSEGGVHHTIARLEKHAVVGEIGLLARECRSASVTAVQPGRAAILPKEKFEHLTGAHPGFNIALSELVAERIGTLAIDILWGKVIDRYQIRHRLGRGGMGVIYAATHLSSGRNVAVKMLRHDLVFDRMAIRRFHQEAEIVKGLNHPNIVRIYDEFSAYGTCFIVMELCDGVSLSEVLQSVDSLSNETVRRIIGQIAAALAHSHAASVAHRDLKPSNVMMDRDGVVKLTDFGLARCRISDTSLTSFSQLIGTPMYMAPEQLMGERGDERSDLFALGVILYELITGRRLFDSKRFEDLLRERQGWSIPGSTEIHPDLDPDLYEIMRSCLAERPESRNVCLRTLASWAFPVEWREFPRWVWTANEPTIYASKSHDPAESP